MKYLICSLLLILVSCTTFNPIYLSRVTSDPRSLIDSIATADGLIVPDTSQWIKVDLINYRDTTYIRSYSLNYEKNKKYYLLVLTPYSDTEYIIDYRVEK